jgi:hypothetical protein
MNPILRNILFVTVFSFSLMFDCSYFGVQYDTYYKISPEFDCSGCLCGGEMYGARWTRLATVFFYLFVGSFIAIFIHLWRNEQADDFNKLSIFKP